jgi:Ribbon-helix-helix protein, copG family
MGGTRQGANQLRIEAPSLTVDRVGYPRYLEHIVKVLISLNDALLRRVDRIAKARGLSRSAYLAELAERDAARSEGPGRTRTARRALSRLDELFAAGPVEDSTVAIRAERDGR